MRDYEGNPFKGPRSLCFDSGGQLFFTDGGAYGETSLHTPTGSCFVVTGEANSRILRPVALDCLAHPTGVTLNPTESAVYVTEQVRGCECLFRGMGRAIRKLTQAQLTCISHQFVHSRLLTVSYALSKGPRVFFTCELDCFIMSTFSKPSHKT